MCLFCPPMESRTILGTSHWHEGAAGESMSKLKAASLKVKTGPLEAYDLGALRERGLPPSLPPLRSVPLLSSANTSRQYFPSLSW